MAAVQTQDTFIDVDKASAAEAALSGINKSEKKVDFQKTRLFVDSIKQFIHVMSFGAELAELGFLNGKAEAPIFDADPKVTIGNALKRFNVITKSAITLHPAFKTKLIQFFKYERAVGVDRLSSNGNDLENQGRYKIQSLIPANINLSSIAPERVKLIDQQDKITILRDLMYKYAKAFNLNVVTGTEQMKASLEGFVSVLAENYEIFLVPSRRKVPNITTDLQINDILINKNIEMNTILSPFLHSHRTGPIKLMTCFTPIKGEDAKPYHPGSGVVLSGDFDKSLYTTYTEYLVTKYFSDLLDEKSLKNMKTKLSAYGESSSVDYTIAEFLGIFAQRFNFEYSKSAKQFTYTTTTTDTSNYLIKHASMNADFVPGLAGTEIVLAKRTESDGKWSVDLGRFNLYGNSDVTLNATSIRSPKVFMEFHNSYNTKLMELVNASG